MDPTDCFPVFSFSTRLHIYCYNVGEADVVEICSHHLGLISAAYITFCKARWIEHTIHRISSARELCLDSFTASLNSWPIQCGLCWSAPLSPLVQPFSSSQAAILANTVTSLPAATAWHGDQCIIFGTMAHLHTKVFKNQGAMILCQWSYRQACLLLMSLAPLSTAQTS